MIETLDSIALSLQILSCLFMAGVISVIQLIHYPSFVFIKEQEFKKFHTLHTKALGWIAGPFMLIELLTALWLAKNGGLGFILNLLAVLLLWGVTFLISVPSHHILANGFNEKAWIRLVKTNQIRTLLWSIRAVMFSVLFLARI